MEDVGVTVVTADGTESFPLHESAEVDAERTAHNRGSGGGAPTYGAPAYGAPAGPATAPAPSPSPTPSPGSPTR